MSITGIQVKAIITGESDDNYHKIITKVIITGTKIIRIVRNNSISHLWGDVKKLDWEIMRLWLGTTDSKQYYQ